MARSTRSGTGTVRPVESVIRPAASGPARAENAVNTARYGRILRATIIPWAAPRRGGTRPNIPLAQGWRQAGATPLITGHGSRDEDHSACGRVQAPGKASLRDRRHRV